MSYELLVQELYLYDLTPNQYLVTLPINAISFKAINASSATAIFSVNLYFNPYHVKFLKFSLFEQNYISM